MTITIPSDLTEDDAFTLLRQLETMFGWAASVVTRSDVDSIVGADLTDEQWSDLRNTSLWRKVLPEIMWDAASEAVSYVSDEIVPEED